VAAIRGINGAADARIKMGFINRLLGRPRPPRCYTSEEKQRLDQLSKAEDSLNYNEWLKPPNWEMYLDHLKLRDYLRPIIEKKEKEEAKRRHEKAILASAMGKTREAGNAIKRALKKEIKEFPNCPYCKESLGNYPHCDHIHPVSHGGLSKLDNMIYICSSCNLKKGDSTLREFIGFYGLNRNEVEKCLLERGKRI
jgi:5-methylcytosine-specific restriction endonuclease McrA